MGKIQKIKEAIKKAPDSDAIKAIKYLLWFIESQELQNDELRKAFRRVAPHGTTDDNYSNWISHKRKDVDDGSITIEEYNQWLAVASENDKHIVVAGKKVPKDP